LGYPIHRGFCNFHRTSLRAKEVVMPLPGLGDAITEGVVVQWVKQVGEEVAEDDVLAVIETDKVSVDIKATDAGILVKQFAAVDDTVEVGSPLCAIEGDELAAAKAKEEAEAEEREVTPAPEPKKPDLEDAMAGAFMAGADFLPPKKKCHVPLIKFLGKRLLLQAKQEEEEVPPHRHRHTAGALDVGQV
ncbi:unnamed protein product, partial [Discosporangium mesarthrocarpum]